MSLEAHPEGIERILHHCEAVSERALPPVHLWNPPFCGDIDIRICRNGQWLYQGTPINRKPLVKLFSSILRRDEDQNYYLVTPIEKVRIQVEDAPFVANLVHREEYDGQQVLKFTTNTDDVILAGPEHRLWVETDPVSGEPAPYIHVRADLHALIARNAFYELVDWIEQLPVSDRPSRQVLGVFSQRTFFVISEHETEALSD